MNLIRQIATTPRQILMLTLGRLLLVPLIILSLGAAPAVTLLALSIFILLDLYDGVAARRLDVDDVARRVLDSAVDRLSIWPVYIAAGLEGFLPISLLLLLGARDLYCARWCYQLVAEREVAIKADWLYRSLNLALAAWIVVAPFIGPNLRAELFAAIFAYSILVAVDLRRSVRIVLGMPAEVSSRVISASSLRRIGSEEQMYSPSSELKVVRPA